LEKTIYKWESEREERLIKEKEQREYEHNLKLSQIKDTHKDISRIEKNKN